MVTRQEPQATNDLTTLSGRTRHILDVRQLSQHALETRARLSRGYVSRILSNERIRLSPDLLRRIADAAGVSFEWYATGRGDMEGHGPFLNTAVKLPSGPSTRDASSLETALAYHGNKWPAHVVAAARAMAAEHKLAPAEWAQVLDDIEAALRKIRIPTKPRL